MGNIFIRQDYGSKVSLFYIGDFTRALDSGEMKLVQAMPIGEDKILVEYRQSAQ